MNTYQITTAPRKIVALLLALCMALALLPGMEIRAEAAVVELNSTIYLKTSGVTTPGLYYTAGAANADGATDLIEPGVGNAILGGGQYSYDATGANGTPLLTLNDVQVTSTAATVLRVTGVTIALVGVNSLTPGNGSIASSRYGLLSTGSSTLTISGSGSLTAASGSATGGDSNAIHTMGALTIAGGANVTATGGTSTSNSNGILVTGRLTVTGGAIVTATGGDATTNSYGVQGSITVSDGGTLKLASGSAPTSKPCFSSSDFTVPAGGYRYTTAETDTNWTGISSANFTSTASGVTTHNLWVKPLVEQTQRLHLYHDTGELKLVNSGGMASEATSGVDYTGQYSYDKETLTLTLTNFHFTTSAQNVLSTSATSAITIVLVGENRLISTRSSGADSYALNVAGGTIIRGDGTLTAIAGNPEAGVSCGIIVKDNGTLTIEDTAAVTATGGTAPASNGIKASMVTVNDNATLTATGGTGTPSYGIYSNLTVNGGTVTASGNTKGINGDITFNAPYRWWSNSDSTANPGGAGTLSTVADYDGELYKFLKIATAPAAQTQTLYLDTTNKKLRLGGAGDDKPEALPITNYTGSYDYDVTTNTLTLNNFRYTSSADYAMNVHAASPQSSPLTIELIGENSITNNKNGAGSAVGLNANTLTITGSGTLTATGGTSTDDSSTGMYISSGGALTIAGSAEVDATGGVGYYHSQGIGGVRPVTVTGGATLTATGGTGNNGNSYGIAGDITVDSGTVTISGKTQAVSGTVTPPNLALPTTPYKWWVNSTTTDPGGTGTKSTTFAYNRKLSGSVVETPKFAKIAPLATDATLSALTVNAGAVTITPAFGAATLGYSASVAGNVSSVTIAATATDTNASVAGAGVISLNEGYNALNITVTAEDGVTSKTYIVGITRAQSDASAVAADKAALTWAAIKGTNTSQSAVTSNLILPTNSGNGTTITWASDDTAVISTTGTVTRPLYEEGDAEVTLTATITKGAASDTVTFDVTVTKQAASNDASLSALTVNAGAVALTPAFNAATLGYSASVASDVASVTIAATANGTHASVAGTGVKSLEEGYNPFTITVTAQDGTTTKAYTLGITRAAADVDPGDNPGEDPGENPVVPVNPVAPTVSPASLNLTAGGSGTLHLTLGTSYTGAAISSSDTAIATVSPASVTAAGDVQVNGVAAGNVVITINFTGGTSAYSTVVPVIVSAAQLPSEPEVSEPEVSQPETSQPETGTSSTDDSQYTPAEEPTPSNTPAPVTVQQAAKSAQDAVKAAIAAGTESVSIKLKNPSEIGRAALQAIAGAANSLPGGAAILADSLSSDGKKVDVRIKLDVKEAVSDLKTGVIAALNLAASTESPEAKQVQSIFDAYYTNDKQAVHFEMEGTWGQPVEVAVKLAPHMDSGTFYFYAYDKKTNRYTQITRPAYWIDKNGYVHFTTELAGDIVISEEPLEKK